MSGFKTYTAKKADLAPHWRLIDADGQVLGRLASRIAIILRGKDKSIFSPHMLVGDYVVVVNARKIAATGKKSKDKQYFRYTGYPGGLRITTLEQMLEKHPERALEHAVRGMLPKNRLGKHLLRRLRVYPDAVHPHQAQVNAGAGAAPAPAQGKE
ncbi:MAG: 50S ribosomal protein L13 [Chloroflexi bacterium]|nr:50S ribosomal protein L13 [Chloroflexota bacterium]